MRGFLIPCIIFSIMLTGCHKDSLPSCVDDAIKAIKKHDWSGSVTKYNYHGNTVYWVKYNTCFDCSSPIYDGGCNIICESGGFGGSICPDSILKNLTNEEIIFAQ